MNPIYFESFQRAMVLAAKGTAGVLAAVAGLALGLHEMKRSLRAEEKLDFWNHASFELRLGGDGESTFSAVPESVVQERLEKLAKVGGFSVDEFQAAARRLRPVEFQMQELEERLAAKEKRLSTEEVRSLRQEEEEALLRRWGERGYLGPDKEVPTPLFGRRITSDAQGADIGVRVPPYLMVQDGVPTVQRAPWNPRLREDAAEALQRWGCVLLRSAITEDDVGTLRDVLGVDAKGSARKAGEVGQWMKAKDPNISMGRFTFGRLHTLLRGSPEFETYATAMHAVWAPLVHRFFADAEVCGERVFLSEAQLIVAEPMAKTQYWHLDVASGKPGLTVMVPLTAVSVTTGAQELLPGSHALHDSNVPFSKRVRLCLSTLGVTHGAVSSAEGCEWRAGDALVVDGRLFHRGTFNDSFGKSIPMIVLRYDLASAPPPGCGRLWLKFSNAVGRGLHTVFQLYSVV